jgi:hypothetical protein
MRPLVENGIITSYLSVRSVIPTSQLVGSDFRAWHRVWTDYEELGSNSTCLVSRLNDKWVLVRTSFALGAHYIYYERHRASHHG